MNFDWKDIVKSVAPALGSALSGPLAGSAVSTIGHQWLGNDDATEGDVREAIVKASPERLARLREIDEEFRTRMQELDLDLEKLETREHQSAREMLAINIWPQIVLSAVFGVGYFVVLILFMTGDVSVGAELRATFNIVLGVLTAAITAIVQF